MWWFTKLLLGIGGLGFVIGLIVAQHDETIGRRILLGSIGGGVGVPAIGFLFADLLREIGRVLKRMNRFRYRTWGHYPTCTGFILLIALLGGESETLTPYVVIFVSGVGLIIIGWLINHWPRGTFIQSWESRRLR